MIIMLYLFIPALTYLPPEYFLLDIICYMHTCAHPASPLGIGTTRLGSVTDSPGPHVQVMELGACEFSLLLIRVAQQ